MRSWRVAQIAGAALALACADGAGQPEVPLSEQAITVAIDSEVAAADGALRIALSARDGKRTVEPVFRIGFAGGWQDLSMLDAGQRRAGLIDGERRFELSRGACRWVSRAHDDYFWLEVESCDVRVATFGSGAAEEAVRAYAGVIRVPRASSAGLIDQRTLITIALTEGGPPALGDAAAPPRPRLDVATPFGATNLYVDELAAGAERVFELGPQRIAIREMVPRTAECAAVASCAEKVLELQVRADALVARAAVRFVNLSQETSNGAWVNGVQGAFFVMKPR